MDYKKHIEIAINYIEENLQNNINIADCAKTCGYSVYHFLRVFKEVTGLTPADYIRKRRLSEVVRQMTDKNKYLSEIAFRYGFNSKENFLRAFKTEHNILPTEYKSVENSLKLYDKFTFQMKSFSITPKIVEIEPFCLTVYKSDENHIPKFWNKYNAKGLSLKLSGGTVTRDYGVSIWNYAASPDARCPNYAANTDIGRPELDYYIGIRSEYAKGNISNTIQLNISGGLYAIFSTPVTNHDDFVNNIHKTWDYINYIWLPESKYRRTGGYEFECYIEKSRVFSEDIYIPIIEKENLK